MRAIVHIGFHKTGTTSIQAFLNDNRDALAANEIAFYQGRHIRRNHAELHAAAMRDERTSPFKLMLGSIPQNYGQSVASEIAQFRNAANAQTLVFSAEGLSYLRYPDEMERLRELIGIDDIKIIAYLRERKSWLESYKAQLRKRNLSSNGDANSFAYVSSDSWLLDFQTRISAFKDAFGTQNVLAIDYDDVCRRDGNVIPSFLKAIGLPEALASDADHYRLNVKYSSNPDKPSSVLLPP